MFHSEEIKPILDYVQKHIKENDTIYIYYVAENSFNYYAKSYGFDKLDYIKGVSSRKEWAKYKEDLSQFKGQERVWIIFTHVYHNNIGEGEKKLIWLIILNLLEQAKILLKLLEPQPISTN